MSPTTFRSGGFRVYFFSREEPRPRVHVRCASGRAKFWLFPHVMLAKNRGLGTRQLRDAHNLVEERFDEILAAWKSHFGS